MTTQPFDVNTRIAQYVALRDLIKEEDDAHKEKMASKRQILEQLGNLIMRHLQDQNVESMRTDAGTAYLTSKKSASLADADAFMKHVLATGDFDLLDRRANVTAVEDYITTHGVAPPGVNWSVANAIGIRRR
jgi:hypothetical protein